jgi:hypothetical protein
MSTAPSAEGRAVARDAATVPRPRRQPTGVLPLVTWAAGTVAVVVAVGLPHTRDWVFVWVLLGALALSVGDLGGWARGVVVDWLPFFAVMTVYDLARGGADGWLAPTHFLPQADADRWLFGGAVPSVWLQQELDDPLRVQWFEAAAFFVYVSHFFVAPLLAAWLWVRDRWRFRRFAVALALLTLLGCVTFVAFPAAPPWLASEEGVIEPTTRMMSVLWPWVGIEPTQGFVGTGYRYANDVAAVPSLHAALALLVALFAWPRRRWGRALVAAYPLAMAFTIVYTAEHYVVDVLLGWIYAVAAFVAIRRLAARLEARRSESMSTIVSPTSR